MLSLSLVKLCTNDESENQHSHVPQGIFMPDSLDAAILPISRLGDRLRIYWLEYPEAVIYLHEK